MIRLPLETYKKYIFRRYRHLNNKKNILRYTSSEVSKHFL